VARRPAIGAQPAPGCRATLHGVDWLLDGLLNFFLPKTPWKLFVRLVVVAALVIAYLVAEDAGSLPWQ